MTKLDKEATSHNLGGGGGGGGVSCTYAKTICRNPHKSYRVYKVIDVLYTYNTILGMRVEGYPANKIKSLILIKF